MSYAPLRSVLAIAALLLATANGCTSVNRQLNPSNTPIIGTQLNGTRAAMFVDLVSIAAEQKAPILALEKEDDENEPPALTTATTTPATTQAAFPASPPPSIDQDGFFVGIAISGGGSRSANFSAACMFELQRLGLLNRVDYISSVSGGSLTAAHYCLCSDAEWNPGDVQRKLTHSFARDVIISTLLPWNMFALAFSDYDRNDLLADSFEKNLFMRDGRTLTFADLRADRPRLLINSTDLQSGRSFVFCNESFDEINSDLSKYPIAYAVSASAAVPIVMHQVTLRDFSTIFKQYRHLVDGGLSDNLGIQTLVDTYDGQVNRGEKTGLDPYPHGAILIVIDARTRFDAQLSEKGDVGIIESLRTGAELTSTALLNRASSATLSDVVVKYSSDELTAKELRRQIATLERRGCVTLKDRHGRPVRVVHLALSRTAELSNLPFQSFSEKVNSISTYFDITDREAYDLFQAGKLLVREYFDRELQGIVRDLDGGTTQPTTREHQLRE